MGISCGAYAFKGEYNYSFPDKGKFELREAVPSFTNLFIPRFIEETIFNGLDLNTIFREEDVNKKYVGHDGHRIKLVHMNEEVIKMLQINQLYPEFYTMKLFYKIETPLNEIKENKGGTQGPIGQVMYENSTRNCSRTISCTIL